MNNQRKILVPRYMAKFECIGSLCEDTCCAGWTVIIDEKTYKEYGRTKDIELREVLNNNISRNRNTPTKNYFAKIKLNEKGECPFLTQNKLCRIQDRLGAEALSATCSVYPRIINVVNKAIEKSLTLSCPEATRLVLLNPNLMEFDEIEEVINKKEFVKGIINVQNNNVSNLETYFWKFRIFTIQLLQNRYYRVWERLIILGMFYNKIQKAIEENKINDIQSIIDSYTTMIDSNMFGDILNKIPIQSTIQMEILKQLTDIRMLKCINNSRYKECIEETLEGIQYTDESTVDQVGIHYKTVYKNYYEPFMYKREYIYENYLVNYVFSNLFPYNNDKNFFENYVMMIIHYAWIKMHLIGLSGFYKENFTEEHIVKLIQSLTKTIDHNNEFLKQILNILKKNNMATMPYMAILIKN